jgi:hypothetical protein
VSAPTPEYDLRNIPSPDYPLFPLTLVPRRPEPLDSLRNSIDIARSNLQLLRVPVNWADRFLYCFAAGVKSVDGRLDLLGEILHLVHVGEEHFDFGAFFGQRRRFARAHHRG